MKVREITIEPKDMSGVTITAGYAFTTRYHWRVRLGTMLIKLAAVIAGCNYKEEATNDKN